jgi:hypothetical protein
VDRVEEAFVIERNLAKLGHRGHDVIVVEIAPEGLLGEGADSGARSFPLRALQFAGLSELPVA